MNPRTKQFLNFAAVALVLAGCSGGNDSPSGGTQPGASKKIVVRGSNTIGEELLPKMIAEYKKDHADADFDLEFKGTAYGYARLLGGYCDIAGASMPILEEQKQMAQDRGVKMKEYVLGSYVVAVIVNAASPVTNLSSNLVAAIFTGRVQTWKDAGGPDAPVHLYIRDPISGTHIGFKELAMNNKSYARGATLFTNYEAIAQAVAGDSNGIGYCGLDFGKAQGIKAVSVDGVAPSVEAVNRKVYPYSRLLRLYTNEAKEAPQAADFVQFALSDSGQRIVTQMGYAPKP